MTKIIKIMYSSVSLIFLFTIIYCSKAQNTQLIAGEYENGLYIYEDGTFLAGGINAIAFGIVKFDGNTLHSSNTVRKKSLHYMAEKTIQEFTEIPLCFKVLNIKDS